MSPDGTQLRKLTGGPLYDAQADWSPDGQKIAFRRGRDASHGLEIWTMDLYGASQDVLTYPDPRGARNQFTTQPSWTPDGRGLLFRATLPPRLDDSDIWTMKTDGSDRHLLVHLDGDQLYPSYSPDMSKVAFTTPVSTGDRAIFTMSPDGSGLTKVFDIPGAFDSAPAWSPDGSRIAFESDMDGDSEIYVMNADGSDVRQLTNNTIHDEGLAWSPDGTRIAFTSGLDNLNGDIWVMNADGSDPIQLTNSPGRDESPDSQPIPHNGDYTACGDVTHTGPRAYSVNASPRVRCEKALTVAARWAADALGTKPGRGLDGFRCESSDAGYGALEVRCVRRHGRSWRPRKSLLFIFRDEAAEAP
jgi:Tol biopolymer transport system component